MNKLHLSILASLLFLQIGGSHVGAEVLYNGITMPSPWPPTRGLTQEYQVPAYLTNPPAEIPIDLGRQLFVDDFLIATTTLTRTPHQPVLYPMNPVLSPGGPDSNGLAFPYSDGVWFDPKDQLFKLWYYGDSNISISYAYSTDGINWVKPNPNVVLQIETSMWRDSDTVWLDLEETNALRRFKAFTHYNANTYFSPDGTNWTAGPATGLWNNEDRSTMFWNPFRKLWIASIKKTVTLPATATRQAYSSRVRYYAESQTLTNWSPNDLSCFWTGPDVNDPPYYGPGGACPQLYNLDVVAYESLLVGLFGWFHSGPPNYGDNGPGPTVVEVGAGFSRDGFSWVRPTRGFGANAFLQASDVTNTWNAYNTQSAGGCLLVVGDELWFYFSGRTLQKPDNGIATTGLATLRRDGFYSMDAGTSEGTLTTRPVTFSGSHLFVNVDAGAGQLLVEVLDTNGNVITPFTRLNCNPVTANKTLQEVTWNGGSGLAAVAGQPVQFRFSLTNGRLYAFWVAADTNGASTGYIAAGGPGFTGPTDTVGATSIARPTGVTALGGAGQIGILWNTATGATGYNVWRSLTNGGSYTRLNSNPVTATNYTDTAVANGSNYFFVVTAVGPSGESGASIPASATPAVLPPGFGVTQVANGLTNPRALEIANDGRVFIAQQDGTIRVLQDDALLATPFARLTVYATNDCGVLGLALDASNLFLYVHYTTPSPAPHNRISRLGITGNMMAPQSETVLYEMPNLGSTTSRLGGAIHVGPDGKLYVGVGDYENNSNATNLTSVMGKILRLNSDGSIPSDNPFSTSVWAYGLRNPVTTAFQPGTGRFFINDQGQTAWEEINFGAAGANYGWPANEGTTNVYSYPHTDGCAIAGGAFYNPATQQFPSNYAGRYFFQDFCGGWIRTLDPVSNAVSNFLSGAVNPTDLRVAPDGSLYFLTSGGEVYKIRYALPVPSVILDTNPPVALRAFNVDATTVEVDFSEPLEAASATNLANYVFANGLAITRVSLTPDGKTVLLTTATLACASDYTLVVNALRDQAIPPNTIAANTTVSFTTPPRQRILLDAGWRFRLGDPADVTTDVTYYPEIASLMKLTTSELSGPGSESYYETNRINIFATHAGENVSFVQTNFDDSAWRLLNLPHDWAVELPFNSSAGQNHGFKPVGDPSFGTNNIGWYRHTFTLPTGDAGQSLWLEFGGVYRNCLVWLNGHILGRNVSGYSSFYFDATPYANPGGTNVLVVRVDANQFEGWFYEGAGIYRHVWLTTENPVHVAEWGTFVATTALSGSNATVTIQTEVTNQSATATANGSLTSTIYDAGGNAVASTSSALNIAAGQDLVVTQAVSFTANLWSLQTPYLYDLATAVSNQNAVADIYDTPFGVRTVSIDSTNGVLINGQHVKIQGMCNHQDMAGVGSAFPDRLLYYRIERLKEMGVNAYRTAHNPPASELLDACDQLGMLVLDENRRIGTDTEPLSELSRLIRRDRNHPSVFLWSLANEEYYLQGTSTGATIISTMQNLVHSLDSTRLCSAAQNGSFGSGFSLVLDVNGFNYHLDQLDSYHTNYPAEPLIGTETSALVSDRGVYSNDAVNGYVWGYDIENSGIGGGGTPAEVWWSYYDARPWASGGFSWTGFDYRGEPNPYGWPCINSHFGTLDTCGFPKDNFYYYQANWTYKPVLHLFPHWNWSTPGQPINVWAFGNCQEVELFVNGVSLGRQALNVQGHVEWDNVPYAAGTLQAVGYNFGVPVLTNTVTTAGPPAAIALTPDRSTILADGRDVSVVKVVVLDAQGNVVPAASNEIYFSINGGTILGVGNGNPSSHEADKASQRAAFNGLAEVIVQSTVQPGSITLTATSLGLNSTGLVLTAASSLPPPAAPTGVYAIGGSGQVTVNWDIVPGATTYNLWRATMHGGPYTLVAGNIGGVNLGYTDNTAANPITYYYVVTANGNGTSLSSAEVSAAPVALPAAPSGLVATALSETQVLLTWIDNAVNETDYIVARSLDSNSWSVLTGSLSANSTSYTDATCSASTLYYYRVSCTNQVGGSGYVAASATTPAGVGDGIPGWWRLKYFGNGLTTNNNNSCATCDPDGDGQNNLVEFLDGLDPTNNSSHWLIQATPTNGQLPLTVSFTENSTALTITNRLWDFGDGRTGNGTNPSHTYTNAGTFSVRLTILNLNGSATLVASNLITVSPSRGFWPTVVSAGPMTYWRLNETNGATVAMDYLGFNNGTIGASVTPGVSGPQSPAFPGFETNNTAMRLNYTGGSYLTMPSLNLNTNTVTIIGWINPTGIQAGWSGIMFCRGGSTCAGLNFGPGSIANELRYTWNNSRWDQSTSLAVPTGQWSFVALVVTPTNATIYLGTNGLLNSFTDTVSQPNQGFNAPLFIGYDPSDGSRLFKGVSDEVAIYNHSLTPTQIQQLYTSALTPPPPPPTPFQTWQLQYFGCTNCSQAASDADPLGKGISNNNQFLAGLNPTNPASLFRIISVAPSGNNVVITWQAGGGRTNVIQVAGGQADGSYGNNFRDIASTILAGTGDVTTSYTDLGGATNVPSRYYRIRLGP